MKKKHGKQDEKGTKMGKYGKEKKVEVTSIKVSEKYEKLQKQEES